MYQHESAKGIHMSPPSWTFPPPTALGFHRAPDLSSMHHRANFCRLLFISSLIPFWSESRPWMVSVFYKFASLVAQKVKNLPIVQETWVWSLGWEDPLEKTVATIFLPGEPPWMEESGWLQSMGRQRIGLFKISFNLWPRMYLSRWTWENCIFWCWYESIYRCPLYPVDCWCCWVHLSLFSACWILFISERGVEVSIQTSGFICFFWQLSLCYTLFQCSVVRCKFLSSWRIDPFIIMHCLLLSLVIFLPLKSALSNRVLLLSSH